jgi:hypothetical protein
MAAYEFPAIPELTGQAAADFIKKAENPSPVRLTTVAEAIYKKLAQQTPDKKV